MMRCVAAVAALNKRHCCAPGGGAMRSRAWHRIHCRSTDCWAWLKWKCGHDGGMGMADGRGADSGSEAVAGRNGIRYVAVPRPNGGAVETVCPRLGGGGAAAVAVGAG